MKKLSIILIAFMTSINVAQANMFSLGPRLGGTLAKLIIHKNAHEFEQKFKFGYQAGIVSRVEIANFFVQPEILFTGSRAQIKQRGQNQEVQLSFYKMDIPTMVGVSFFGARLQAGPVLSIVFNALYEGMSHKDLHKQATLGYQFGIGYDLWNLMLDLKFEGNLTSLGKKIAGIDTDHRLQQFVFSVGFNIIPLF
ncbi:MAG: outer membrane beta-barrel protein [Bacteroidota bacterium]